MNEKELEDRAAAKMKLTSFATMPSGPYALRERGLDLQTGLSL